jgi:nickel-dependent lactate racemase
MEVDLKYGGGRQILRIPEKALVSVLKPAVLPTLADVEGALESALGSPIGRPSLEEMLARAAPRSVAIAVPDETRPVPLKLLLPALLRRLRGALPALDPSAFTIMIGGGLHPPPDPAGQERVVPRSLAAGCGVATHDAVRSRMADYGRTRHGTRVRINATFAEADFKIVVGQIDPHQFVGFTGGSKGVVIGLASKETIEQNHALMFHAAAQVGVLEGNPVREDLDDAGELVGIDLAVDVALDPEKKVVRLLAGAPIDVLREGARTSAEVYGVGIDEKFDIVIASCGGHPKDITLYQAQKGLNLASHAVEQGGKILLLAACPQGVGDEIYFDYVCQFATPAEVLDHFQKLEFKIGAHKAYLFGRTLANFDVAVASDLDPDILRKCHLRAADPSVVIRDWVEHFQGRPRVAIVPSANTTYFHVRSRAA